MKINKKWGDKIYIEWIDACEKTGWQSQENAEKLDDEIFCFTNAHYIGKDKYYIKVAHTVGKSINNDVCGIIHIPIKWIIKMR